MSKRKFDALKAAVLREGYDVPIICRDTDNGLEVIDGEHRWRAMVEVYGADFEVDVVIKRTTETMAKLGTLAYNRIRGEHKPIAEALVMADLLREMSVKDLEMSLGMPSDQIEDTVALLGEDAPAVQDREPLMEVSVFLYRDQFDVYTHALEKAMTLCKATATPLVGHQADAFDAAMKKAMRLVENANRAQAFELIMASFLATDDVCLT